MEKRDSLVVPWNHTICLAGARNQGKTNLAISILLQELAPKCDLVLLFGNGASSLQWDFLNGKGMKHRTYAELKPEVIEECFRINEARLQKKKAFVQKKKAAVQKKVATAANTVFTLV